MKRRTIKTFISILGILVIFIGAWFWTLLTPVHAAAADNFITTWKTDNSGVSNSTSITIPTVSGETYNYDVDWNNDGVFDQLGITGDVTHDFGAAGTYTIRIQGNFPRIKFGYYTDKEKIINIDQWGTGIWSSMAGAFEYASKMTSTATDIPRLDNVTDMSSMFSGAAAFNGDLSNWNVSSVTDMSSMFSGAAAFNGDLSNWNVSSVTDMSSMFSGAAAFNGDLSNWNVSSVTNMSSMFSGAAAFNGDLSNWNVSSVTNMFSMFGYFNDDSGASTFNGDLSSWNVSNVTDMSQMFYRAYSFNSNISLWNTSKVTNMAGMFGHAYAFNSNISLWNTSKVTNMAGMFGDANYGNQPSAFNSNISLWNTSSVTNMSEMFYYSESFNSDISGWDTSKVTNMSRMFLGAASFSGNLSGWNTSNVTSMSAMFSSASNFNSDLSLWNTGNVTDMSRMFEVASNFTSNLSGWNTSNVTDMHSMFSSANSFTSDISGWDTSKVTNMSFMLFSTNSFNSDISNWNVSNVTTMRWMLLGSSLSSLNYDKLLAAWSAQPVQDNVELTASSNTCYYASESNRTHLVDDKGWNISDGGKCHDIIISSVSPSRIKLDGINKVLTITGSGFMQGASVTLGGNNVTVQSVSSTQITISVPASLITVPGDFNLEVTNFGSMKGTAVGAVTFYTPIIPVISTISPSSVVVDGSYKTITIGGSGFVPDTYVLVDGRSTTMQSITSNLITITISTSGMTVTKTVDVQVVNPDDESTTSYNSLTFTYTPPPLPTIVSVQFSKSGGKNYLVVNGNSLNDGNYQNVRLNGSLIPFCSDLDNGFSAQNIVDTFHVPAGTVSDTPTCYVLIDLSNPNIPKMIPTATKLTIWLADNFDTTATGTLKIDNLNTFSFDGAQTTAPTVTVGGDTITNTPKIAAKPTFAGKAPAGSIVVVTVHSDPITCTTTADSNGDWTCTLPSSLPAGTHSVIIQVTAPDNTVTNLGPFIVTVDGENPTIVESPPKSVVKRVQHAATIDEESPVIAQAPTTESKTPDTDTKIPDTKTIVLDSNTKPSSNMGTMILIGIGTLVLFMATVITIVVKRRQRR